MAQTIKLKRSSVAGNIPGSSDLALGEIAVNTADGALYIKKGDNTIVAVGDNDILHIDTSNGRVGVGTTSPSAELTVSGTIANDAFTIPNSIGTAGQVLKAPSSGTTLTWADESGSSGAIAPSINTMTGDGSTTTLTLSTTPVNENATIITFDGVLQHKSTYSLSGSTITFSTAPANGVAVECIVINTHSIQALEDGDSDTKIQVEETADEDKIRFDTAGTERMIIDASGNVGIGTTSPNQLLEVKGTSGTAATRIHADTITSPRAELEFMRGTTDTFGGDAYTDWKIGTVGATQADFAIISSDTTRGSNERLTIEYDTGNVGIGTTSPSYKLSVSGNIGLTDGVSTASHALVGGNYYIQNTGAYSTIFQTNGTERMRIDSSGNVGIGTSSPTNSSNYNTLDIVGTDGAQLLMGRGSGFDFFNYTSSTITRMGTGAGQDLAFHTNSGGTSNERLRITSAGNVGIGISIPNRKVVINDAADAYTLELRQDSAYNSGNQTGILFGAKYNATGSNADLASIRGGKENTTDGDFGGKLAFYTRANGGVDTERMRIDSSGNLLVGKTASDLGATAGIELNGQYDVGYFTRSGEKALVVNRLSTDGTIADFRKDGTTVGSIGTVAGDINIGSGDTALRFQDSTDAVFPAYSSGGGRGSAINLGLSSVPFKDLYLSGNITVGGTVDGRDVATDGTKLDGIESGATADQTQSDINALAITQVGTISSGTWQGTAIASAYLDSDTAHLSGAQTFSGAKTFSSDITLNSSELVHNNATFGTFDWRAYQGDTGDLTWTVTGTSGAEMTLTSDGSNYANASLSVGGASVITTTNTKTLTNKTITSPVINTGVSGTAILDEDTMSSNSATQLATQQSIKAYVDTQVAGVVDSAPAALDTLNELAAALGDDANFSTTTSTALGNRLRVDTAAQGLTGTQQANAITNLGITATKAELNYVDGVTSNIQTQLDGKQASGSYLTGNQTITLSGDVSGSGTTSIAVTIADDSHNHVISNVDGLQTALDAKLASSSYTAADVLTKIKTVDGAGSGLDADLLDGISSASFLRSDADDTHSGTLTVTTALNIVDSNTSLEEGLADTLRIQTGTGYIDIGSKNTSYVHFETDRSKFYFDSAVHFAGQIYNYVSGGTSDPYWRAGNDGAGSGLDADLLDGQQGSYYAPASTALTTSTSFGGDVSGTYNAIVVADDSHNHVISNVDGLQTALDGKTSLDHIRSLGAPAFTGGTDPNITTAQYISEMEGDGAFDSYSSIFKTSWSYAGNYNLSDAGSFGPTETAGMSHITWTDNSSDIDKGHITVLAIAPTTGGSAGGVYVYNDQGSSYTPGWREIWTSSTDGAGSGLDADLLDAQQGSYYLDYNNFTNTPTIPSLSGYATESYVGTQISNLVDSAPSTLDTLNELAAALGDDANFSTTVTNSIALKAPLASPSFTGNITVAGDGFFNGTKLEGDSKEMIRYNDIWLRLNPDNDFTGGIYCGSGILRTDGEFQVGGSGAYFKVTSAGNVTLAGTLDGRDIASDGTKLDGIESGATADQTQSEINALGITATGLSGTPNITVGTISSGAITSTGNFYLDTSPASNGVGDLQIIPSDNSSAGVGYAGQVLGVNISSSLSSNSPKQANTWGGVTGATAIALQADDNSYGQFQVWTSPQDSSANTVLTPRFYIAGNGNATFSGNITVSGTVDGRDVATDGSKLDGIESGATADQTQSDINALGITQVGTISSGTWQGTAIASAYLDSDTAHLSGTQTFTGNKTFTGSTTLSGGVSLSNSNISGVNAIQMADPGPNEGVTWSNIKIYESPDDLTTNTAGNFQVVYGSTRRLTVNSTGVDVNGALTATTKSFDIDHPSKEGMRLHHGVVEGPEHSVYVRGKSKEKVILLPDYWVDLIHEDSITVQLTAIGGGQNLYVEDIKDNKVYVNGENYFYYIQAERKDIERFEVEYEV